MATEQQGAAERHRGLPWSSLTVIVIYLATHTAVPYMGLAPTRAVYLGSTLSLTLLTLLVAGTVAAAMHALPRWALILGVLAGVVTFGMGYGLSHQYGRIPGLASVGDLAFIVMGACLGSALAQIVRDPKILLPALVTVMVVDAVSIWGGGPLGEIIIQKPAAVERLAAAIPKIGTGVSAVGPRVSFVPDVFVGVGDILFAGFFVACAARFWTKIGPTLAGVLIGAALGMLVAVLWHLPVPGLLFIGAGALLPNLRRFQFTDSERKALAVAGVLVALFCVGLILLGELIKR